MKAGDLSQWRNALRFTIGHGSRFEFSQLPWPGDFPETSASTSEDSTFALGQALALGALKVLWSYREHATNQSPAVWLSGLGHWAEDLEHYDPALSSAVLFFLGRVIGLELIDAEKFRTLKTRIDALDNETLHDIAVDALEGRPSAEGLLGGLSVCPR